jgi:hypothetical protein
MRVLQFFSVAMVLAYSTGQQVTSKFENLHLDDVIFNNNLLFEQNARSKVICAQLCTNHCSGNCVTFTYLSRSRMCRGHTVVMTQSSATEVISARGTIVQAVWYRYVY